MIDQLRGNSQPALDDNSGRNIGHRDYGKATGEENYSETADQKHHIDATDEKHHIEATDQKHHHYSKTTDEKDQQYGQTADQNHRIHGQKVVVTRPNEDEVSRIADAALPGRKTDELEPHFITLSE